MPLVAITIEEENREFRYFEIELGFGWYCPFITIKVALPDDSKSSLRVGQSAAKLSSYKAAV